MSGVQTGGGGGGSNSVHNEDGSINTGHIPNWKSLSFKEHKILIDERKRLGIKYKKSGARSGGRGKSPSTDSNRIQQLKELPLLGVRDGFQIGRASCTPKN